MAAQKGSAKVVPTEGDRVRESKGWVGLSLAVG